MKGLARVANGFLQTARRLLATTINVARSYPLNSELSSLEKAVGLAQHHDGLSGTEKQVRHFLYQSFYFGDSTLRLTTKSDLLPECLLQKAL